MLRVIGGAAQKGVAYTATLTAVDPEPVHTFSDTAIGDAYPNRYTLLCIQESDLTTGIASITVGGNSALEVVNLSNGTRMWIASAPAGTTADIVITADAGGDGELQIDAVHVVSMWGLSSSTPHDSDTISSTSPASVTLNVPSDGFVVAFANEFAAGSGTFAWSGGILSDADELYDNTPVTGAAHAVAGKSGAGAVTGGTITSTESGGRGHRLIAASWS